MSRAQEIRDAQARTEREWDEDQAQRQESPVRPAPPVTSIDYCAASRSRTHNFSMRGRGGKFRCWGCARTRAEVYGS